MGNCFTDSVANDGAVKSKESTESKKEELGERKGEEKEEVLESRKEKRVGKKDKGRTIWSVSISSTGEASLSYKISPNSNAVPFKIKGVCYSPTAIGNTNKFGPALGDWFWDSYTAGTTSISNWSRYWQTKHGDATYRHDLDNIKSLNANTIRVYCMLPYQLNNQGNAFEDSHIFTHKTFLDECQSRDLSVFVGFPMPTNMFIKGTTMTIPSQDWIDNFTQLLADSGTHPAVIGYIFLNEVDGQDISYPIETSPDQSTIAQLKHYWNQVEAIAALCKKNAPDKLNGVAFHNNPFQWTQANSQYLNLCQSVDFWGVNAYETQNFNAVFSKWTQPVPAGQVTPMGMNQLNELAIPKGGYNYVYKPVIITEFGIPGTSHNPDTEGGQIFYSKETGNKAASVLQTVLPQAYNGDYPLCLGLIYFEYCDEWWNSTRGKNIWTWNGGKADAGLPNGFWDNEGFGLYGISMNPSNQIPRNNDGCPINWHQSANAPYPYTNPVEQRIQMTTVLQNVFQSKSI